MYNKNIIYILVLEAQGQKCWWGWRVEEVMDAGVLSEPLLC